MTKRIIAIGTIGAILLASASTLFASGAAEQNETVTVVGIGEVTAEPDQAVITLGVQLFNEDALAASEELAERMTQVLDAISALGVPSENIQTTNYSIFFEREYQPRPDQLEGPGPRGMYRVENMVEVTIPEVERAATVVQAAISAGANQMYGIRFGFSDPMLLEAEAQARAMKNARAKAQILAASEGLTVGKAVVIVEAGARSPRLQATMDYEGRGGPVMPGEGRYSRSVEVTFELE
ncbi:MAG: SIMPL domain-containing protein [Spirochaetales bacterium]